MAVSAEGERRIMEFSCSCGVNLLYWSLLRQNDGAAFRQRGKLFS
jgi:hypothetical protein